MHIYIYTFASPIKCVFEPSKELKSKTINARKKTRTVWEFASNSAQNFESRFLTYFFYEERFLNKNINYFFLVQKKPEKKIENWDSKFC